jgi:hypothetical protein
MAYNNNRGNGGQGSGNGTGRDSFQQRYQQERQQTYRPRRHTSFTKVAAVIGVVITGLATVVELLREIDKMHQQNKGL